MKTQETNWDAERNPLYIALQEISFLFSEYHEAKSIAIKALAAYKYPSLTGSVTADNVSVKEANVLTGEPVYRWIPVTAEMFEDEDWMFEHYRYAFDHFKLDTDLFEVKEGYLQKKGGDGKLLFCHIEILEQLQPQTSVPETGKHKPFIVANVREIFQQWRSNDEDGISMNKMVELFNEVAAKYYTTSIQCKCTPDQKHGETSVMCCNSCGLPCEKFWERGEAVQGEDKTES